MGKSQTKAKNKYNAKAYDRVSVIVKKGIKDEWKIEAEKQGLSLNAFIERAVIQMMTSDTGIDYSFETSDITTEKPNTKEQISHVSSENEILEDVILKLTDSCKKLLSAHLQLIDLFPYDKTDEDCGEIKSPYREFIIRYLMAIMSEDVYRIRCCISNEIMKQDVEGMLHAVSAETEHVKDHIETHDLEEFLTAFNALMNISDE